MPNESNILPLVIGAINEKEVYTSAKINCNSEKASKVANIFDDLELNVLFPKDTGKIFNNRSISDKIVPLNGGSILKIKLGTDIYTDELTKAGSKSFDAYQNLYSTISSNLRTGPNSLRKFLDNLDFSEKTGSDLTALHVKINNFLEKTKLYTKKTQALKIPSLKLSSITSEEYQNSSDLQNEINRTRSLGIRPGGLDEIGYFKFIPIETISDIYKEINENVDDSSISFIANKVALSGDTYASIYDKLDFINIEDKDIDEFIARTILNIFPILRIDEDIIDGEGSQPIIGFYTLYKDAIYIKTPDLSGRDSSGDSSNIYGLGSDEVEDNINFAFELSIRANYGAISFDYLAPPVINIIEDEYERPLRGDGSIVIEVEKEGLTQDCQFFLSPILPGSSPGSIKGLRNVRVTSSDLELFTVPNLSVPYFKSDSNNNFGFEPLFSLEFIEKNKEIDKLGKSITENLNAILNLEKSAEYNDGINTVEIKQKNKPLDFVDLNKLGVPLNVGDSFGINTSEYCGISNRPELLLGTRNNGSSSIKNDKKFYSDKIYASKDFFMSLAPNIINKLEQIPYIWIKNSGDIEEETIDNEKIYKIKFKATSSEKGHPFGLSDFKSQEGSDTVEFALYCIDSLGQVSRAPGPNISVKNYELNLSSIKPDGFKDGGIIINDNGNFSGFTLSLGELPEDNFNLDIKLYDSQEEGAEIVLPLEINDQNYKIDKTADGYIINFISLDGEKINVSDAFGSINGRFWIQIGEEPKRLELFIAEPSVTDLLELPDPTPLKIKFVDPEGLRARDFRGYKETLDSVPVLLDGGNAEIQLKYSKKVFKEGSEAYAYFAFLDSPENKDILNNDLALLDTSEGTLRKVKIADKEGEFFIPTDIEWKFGGSNFKRVTNKKIRLKFPGPAAQYNISRFSKIKGDGDKPAAYIILTNESLKESSPDANNFITLPGENGHAYIPVGLNNEVAFINPPHVLGMVAKIPASRGSNSIAMSVDKEKINFNDVKGIKEDDVKPDFFGPIISSDAVDRLAVFFRGPEDEPGISRRYKVKVGSRLLKRKERVGKIKKAESGDNIIVANFKNIIDVKDVGWVNISVLKSDKRFRTSYDSTVYSQATIKFDCTSEKKDPNCDDGIYKEVKSNGNNKAVLASGSRKNILSTDGSSTLNLIDSASIFPEINNYGFSALPYYDEITSKLFDIDKHRGNENKDISGKVDTFSYFINPIRIYPESDLNMRLILSDSGASEVSEGEEVIVDTLGKSEVPFSLEELSAQFEDIQGQANLAKDSINSEKNKLQEKLDNLDEEGEPQRDGLTQEIEKLQKKLDKFDESEESASESISEADKAKAEEEAKRQALEGLDPNASDDTRKEAENALAAAQDAASAAVDKANGAINAVNDALSILNNLSDKLSRASMIANGILDDIEDALSASDRADDFYGVDLKSIFIDKDASIITTNLTKQGKGDSFLVLKARFDQVAVIKFNSPEIITINDKLPSEFATIVLGPGPSDLNLKTIGTNKDTKVEVNRIRVEKIKISEEDGIFKTISFTIDPSKFILVGKDPCLDISITNSNQKRIRLGNQVSNDLTINLEDKWPKHIGGGGRLKQGPAGELVEKLKDNPLRFTSVVLDKANIAKEFMQSFCDMSFHLTAELSLQLRNFKVLLVPIKVILCIIDVICALLHPIRLAFAIIRLFLCLYDLILLLPQLSVPAMLLSLILHILELLLCVIIKVLSIINAINEIITAIDVAIQEQNYPAIIALEETLNEHLFSLEADLQVLEPILTIFGLFLELLELVFAFPCQIGSDEDDPACIDPSMLAGLILSKVAPFGTIAPDALLPLAQTYTTLSPGDTTQGNTPSTENDAGNIFDDADILKETKENAGVNIVSDNTGYGGNNLTGLTNSLTGEPIVIGENGFFNGDTNGDGRLDNIDYTTLRFNEEPEDFQASFGISFTKSVKKFNLFTGPDPRLVEFQFNERGLTNPLAFNWFLAIFFKKKNIELFQPLDSPPGFVVADGNSLKINEGAVGFTSPVDGVSDLDGTSFAGVYLESKTPNANGNRTFQPKILNQIITVEEQVVVDGAIETQTEEVEKLFNGIPMIALVDDEFNVYFVEEGDNGTGGIVVDNINGVDCITSINAKMINYPSAPKKKFSREDREVYRDYETINPKSSRAQSYDPNGSGRNLTHDDPSTLNIKEGDAKLGQIMVYEQANANWLSGEFDPDGDPEDGSNYFSDGEFLAGEFNKAFGDFTAQYVKVEMAAGTTLGGVLIPSISEPPFPEYGLYDWAGGSKKEQNDFGEGIDSVKVFDFPTLYIVDMRHLAEDIAAACGSKPTELLPTIFDDDAVSDVSDLVEETRDCVQSFKDFFLSESETTPGIPDGIVPRIRSELAAGVVPGKVDVNSVIKKYNDTRACLEDKVDDSCKFVINSLNTSFKILNDIDETPLTNYVNPEQEGLSNLINYDIVDEVEFDTDLQGFPKITGAMEYASGVGDSAPVRTDEKALIRIIPRDCYDEILPTSLDLTDSITLTILEDETGTVEQVEPEEGSGLVIKNGGEYTLAIKASAPGRVKIKATVCSVVIQAVAERALISATEPSVEVDCVDDDGDIPGSSEDVFAPGALTKVDRVLTVLFVSPPVVLRDPEQDARLATPSPQVFGTNLEN